MNKRSQRSYVGEPRFEDAQHIRDLIVPALDHIQANQEALGAKDDLDGARAAFNGLLQVIQAGDQVSDEQIELSAGRIEQTRRAYDEFINPPQE